MDAIHEGGRPDGRKIMAGEAEFLAEMARLGMRVVSTAKLWKEVAQSCAASRTCVIAGLDPEDTRLSMQLREQRVAREEEQEPPVVLLAHRVVHPGAEVVEARDDAPRARTGG